MTTCDHLLILHTKVNPNGFKTYIYIRSEAIKLLEENISSTIFEISLSNIILELSPQARATKAKLN